VDPVPKVEKLEAVHSAAVKANPWGLPECGPNVQGPCVKNIETKSEIGQFEGGKWTLTDVLPPAPNGHGEALRGAWVAPDGTEFLAGYMYSGAPGPDTGVVYRKDPGGAWKIVYSKPRNELGHLWGRSSSDVWASGVKTLAHWDGTAWREESVPITSDQLLGIWGDATEMFVGSGTLEPEGGTVYRRDSSGAWTVDGSAPGMLYGISGLGSMVFAVGNEGALMHRKGPGTWVNEGKGKEQHLSVAVVGPHDVYVGGRRLHHSKGDGAWTDVDMPNHRDVDAVWGRSPNDVFAGTSAGVFHFDGKAWHDTDWVHDVEAIAGNDKKVLVANQHTVK
jgi:hypothetical protein